MYHYPPHFARESGSIRASSQTCRAFSNKTNAADQATAHARDWTAARARNPTALFLTRRCLFSLCSHTSLTVAIPRTPQRLSRSSLGSVNLPYRSYGAVVFNAHPLTTTRPVPLWLEFQRNSSFSSRLSFTLQLTGPVGLHHLTF